MKLRKDIILLLCVLALLTIGFAGCGEKGEAEKAGEKIDKTFDAAKDKFKEVTK